MSGIDLHLQGLTRHYGAVRALDSFTHVFAGGQVHALIGKNGSGKSTFIKMMSGAIQPTWGKSGWATVRSCFAHRRTPSQRVW